MTKKKKCDTLLVPPFFSSHMYRGIHFFFFFSMVSSLIWGMKKISCIHIYIYIYIRPYSVSLKKKLFQALTIVLTIISPRAYSYPEKGISKEKKKQEKKNKTCRTSLMDNIINNLMSLSLCLCRRPTPTSTPNNTTTSTTNAVHTPAPHPPKWPPPLNPSSPYTSASPSWQRELVLTSPYTLSVFSAENQFLLRSWAGSVSGGGGGDGDGGASADPPARPASASSALWMPSVSSPLLGAPPLPSVLVAITDSGFIERARVDDGYVSGYGSSMAG